MTEIVIIKSNSGMYHLCRYDPKNDTHYSIQEFISRDLAEAMARKMNSSDVKPVLVKAA